MAEELRGLYTAIVTPFEKTNNRIEPKISFNGLDALIQNQYDAGVNGVVICGCTGYDAYPNEEEHEEIFSHVNKNYGQIQNFKLIAGDGSNTAREAIKLARIAEDAGIYTHLSISPYKVKPSDQGLIEHYLAIAENVSGNIILYSVPGRTGGLGITANVAERLAEHPRIIGIKDASGNMNRIKDILQRTNKINPNFAVFSGDDNNAIEVISNGGAGLISVAANIVPHELSLAINYALNGNLSEAKKINQKLTGLYSALFPKSDLVNETNASPNPTTAYYALRQMGYDFGDLPLPLTDPTQNEKSTMNSILLELNLIDKKI